MVHAHCQACGRDLATDERIAVARTRKAVAIAGVLRRHGADADHARQITAQEARDVVAELANVNSPSVVTWSIACTLLELGEPEVVPAPCRFAVDPSHECKTNAGQPIHGLQECWTETRAQLFEAADVADFDGAAF
jgi:hypothetical protein